MQVKNCRDASSVPGAHSCKYDFVQSTRSVKYDGPNRNRQKVARVQLYSLGSFNHTLCTQTEDHRLPATSHHNQFSPNLPTQAHTTTSHHKLSPTPPTTSQHLLCTPPATCTSHHHLPKPVLTNTSHDHIPPLPSTRTSHHNQLSYHLLPQPFTITPH